MPDDKVTVENDKITVEHDGAASRFEIHLDGQIAFLQYERKDGEVVILHTEVPQALGGRGLGNVLAKTALDWAKAEGLRIVVVCPFVRAYIRKHPTPSIPPVPSSP